MVRPTIINQSDGDINHDNENDNDCKDNTNNNNSNTLLTCHYPRKSSSLAQQNHKIMKLYFLLILHWQGIGSRDGAATESARVPALALTLRVKSRLQLAGRSSLGFHAGVSII